MKKLLSVMLAAILTLSFCACDKGTSPPSQTVSFSATVTAVTENSITVAPDPESGEYKSSDTFIVSTKEGVIYSDSAGGELNRTDLTVGQTISIVYNGTIQETYPAGITATEICVLQQPKEPSHSGSSINFELRGYPCKISLPENWSGACRCVQYRSGSGVDFVSVKNIDYGGVVFAIWALDDELLQRKDIFDFCQGEPILIDSDKQGGVYFYLVRPYNTIQYDTSNPECENEYKLLSDGAESVAKTFAWKAPEDKNEIEKSSQELKDILYLISDTCSPGTAGSALSAAKCAGFLLDWRTNSPLTDDEVRTAMKQWLRTLSDDRAFLFPEQLQCVYEVVPALFSEDYEDLLLAAGYEEAPQLWNRDNAENFFSVLMEDYS